MAIGRHSSSSSNLEEDGTRFLDRLSDIVKRCCCFVNCDIRDNMNSVHIKIYNDFSKLSITRDDRGEDDDDDDDYDRYDDANNDDKDVFDHTRGTNEQNAAVDDVVDDNDDDAVVPRDKAIRKKKRSSNVVLEYIQEIDNVNFNNGIVYPPNPKFRHSYDCWHEHQAVMWSSHESNPEDDRDEFVKIDPELQRICLEMVAFLMWGDSVVVDTLASKVASSITAREVNVFLADQEARENIHQEVYSKMLNVASSEEAKYYRSSEFKNKKLARFESLAQKYSDSEDVRIFFLFIMMCECVMFAPMFQTICYVAFKGYAPKLGDANLQVMRDEALHYKHARGVMASMKRKCSKKLAREILSSFEEMMRDIITETVGDYRSEDGLFSQAVVKGHFQHVLHGFMSENDLYWDSEEEKAAEDLGYSHSPAASYMRLPNEEIKVNLMESISTIYTVDNGVEKNIDMYDW